MTTNFSIYKHRNTLEKLEVEIARLQDEKRVIKEKAKDDTKLNQFTLKGLMESKNQERLAINEEIRTLRSVLIQKERPIFARRKSHIEEFKRPWMVMLAEYLRECVDSGNTFKANRVYADRKREIDAIVDAIIDVLKIVYDCELNELYATSQEANKIVELKERKEVLQAEYEKKAAPLRAECFEATGVELAKLDKRIKRLKEQGVEVNHILKTLEDNRRMHVLLNRVDRRQKKIDNRVK